jgi:hypothetical protein
MNAKQKIENLTHTWYGFTVFMGAVQLLVNGLGVFSILSAAFSTVFSLVVSFAFGRLLLGKSSLTRVLLVAFSAIGTILGVLGAGRMIYEFFGDWSFSLLGYAALALAGVSVNVKSFRVLTDDTVKAHFA